MTSLKRVDNTEAIVEHKLEESIDEENEEVAGDEPDDPRDEEISETTGHELDDSIDEENEEVTGDELDDPGDEDISETTGHELDEPGDEKSAEVTGDEPDDPGGEQSEKVTEDDLDAPGVPESKSFAGNELNRSKDKQSKTYTEKKNKFKGIKKKFRVKRTWFLFLLTGICLLAGGSYYFIQHKNGKEINSRKNIFPIPHDKSFIFESFILPIQRKQGYTYISLDLLLELSNIKLKGEIVEKKDQLRGIIYDILEQEILRVEDAGALDNLKTLIIKRANTVLTSGEVREAFITNFLLV
jgi:flagellar basal body-associated protein FliL